MTLTVKVLEMKPYSFLDDRFPRLIIANDHPQFDKISVFKTKIVQNDNIKAFPKLSVVRSYIMADRYHCCCSCCVAVGIAMLTVMSTPNWLRYSLRLVITLYFCSINLNIFVISCQLVYIKTSFS